MKKRCLSTVLLLSSSAVMATNPSEVTTAEIKDTMSNIRSESLSLVHACQKKEPYTKAKNVISMEYVMKACELSRKFPIDSYEKQLCDLLNSDIIKTEKISCARKAVEKRYSEEDLDLDYKQYLASGVKCKSSSSCFDNFLTVYAIEHASEFDCTSKSKLSYDVICQVAENVKRKSHS